MNSNLTKTPNKLLNTLLNYYPSFLTQLPDTVQYKFVNTISKQFLPLKILLEKLRLQENLDRPIQIWKEQNEPYNYILNFEVLIDNIQKVEIFKDNYDNPDELIYVEEYAYSDNINEFFYQYSAVSESKIPNEHYYVTVTTFDEYTFTKGFPENDNSINDKLNINRELNTDGSYTLKFETNDIKNIYEAQILVNDVSVVDEVFNPTKDNPLVNSWFHEFKLDESEIINNKYKFIIYYYENYNPSSNEYSIKQVESKTLKGNYFYSNIYNHDYSLDIIGARNNFPRSTFIPYSGDLNSNDEEANEKFVSFYEQTEPAFNNRLTEDDYHYAQRLKYYLTNLSKTDLPVLDLYKYYGVLSELINRDNYLVKQDVDYMRSNTCPDDGENVKNDTITNFTNIGNFIINHEKKITVYVIDENSNILTDGNVTFHITDSAGNETISTIPIKNKHAILKYTPKFKGQLNVTALFEGTDSYNSSKNTMYSTVTRIPVTVHGINAKQVIGNDVFLEAYVKSDNDSDNISGSITFSINGKNIAENIQIGNLQNPDWYFDYDNEAITQYLIPFNMIPGTYQVKATYSGDDFFAPTYGEFTLIVSDVPIPTELTYLFLKNSIVGLKIFDDDFNFLNDKPINILLNNQIIDSIISKKNKYILSKEIPAYTEDDTITAEFPGDETHAKSSCIIYPSPEPIFIDTPDKSLDTFFNDVLLNPTMVAFRLHDIEGNVLTGQTVTLQRNDIVIRTVTTNSSWTLINDIGDYTPSDVLTLNFDEVKNYYNSSRAILFTKNPDIKSSILKMDNVVTVINKETDLKVTLLDDEGNFIPDANITFKVDSKTFNAVTNDKGIATIKYTFTDKGAYPVKITFEGNEKYDTTLISTVVTVREDMLNTFFNYIFINPSNITCGLHDENGTYLPNTDVKVQKNGTTISGGAVTTGSGKAWTKIVTLPSYTSSDIISLYYPGDGANYNSVTAQVYPETGGTVPDEPTTQLDTTITITATKTDITTTESSVLKVNLLDSNNNPVIGRYVDILDNESTIISLQTDNNGEANYTYTRNNISSSPETHVIKAQFKGTTGYATSTSTELNINITQSSKIESLTKLVITTENLLVGTSRELKAVVTDSNNNPINSGSVIFYRGTENIGEVELSDGGVAILNYTPYSGQESASIQSFTALFQGTNYYLTSISTNVNRYIYVPTSLVLTADQTECEIESNIKLTAILKHTTNNYLKYKSVQFKSKGKEIGYVTTDENGVATLETTETIPGVYEYTANYAGDSGYDNCSSENVDVTFKSSTKIVTNLTCTTTSVYRGEYVYATLTDVHGNPLTEKNVAFTFIGTTNVTYDTNGVGASKVEDIGNGQYRLLIQMSARTITLTASFDGDDNYEKAEPVSVNLTVKQHTSIMKLVPETHTVSNGENLGVYLYDDLGNPIQNANIKLWVYSLVTDKNGYAYLTLNLNIPGTSRSENINYSYDGSTFVTGYSNTTNVTIYPTTSTTKATPSCSLTCNSYSIPNNSQYTLRATMNTSVATGTIQFFIDGEKLGNPVNLSNGVATLTETVKITNDENHNIYARYNGNTNFNPVNSNNITISYYIQTSNPTNTSCELTSTNYTVDLGNPYTLTAKLSNTDATGTVTFYKAGSVLGTVNVTNGVAQLQCTSSNIGSFTFYAQYNGYNYNNCTSSDITINCYDSKAVTFSGAPSSMKPGDTFGVYLKDYQGNPIIGQHVTIQVLRNKYGTTQTFYATTNLNGKAEPGVSWNYVWTNETITVTCSYAGSEKYNSITTPFTVHWN